MGDSFEKVKADEAAVAMFEQAQVIAISTLLEVPCHNSPVIAHAQRIVEYERLLIGLGCWSENDSEKFPRFMLIAEEAKGKVDMVADGVSGRVRKHLATSTQKVTAHVDARIDTLEKKMGATDSRLENKMGAIDSKLEKKMGALDSKLDALSTKLEAIITGAQARG